MQSMYKCSKDYRTRIKVLFLLHLHTYCFKVYGQCAEKMKTIQHAAPILSMQNSKLVQRNLMQEQDDPILHFCTHCTPVQLHSKMLP